MGKRFKNRLRGEWLCEEDALCGVKVAKEKA